MIQIFFEVGGRTMTLETAEDPMERAIMKSVAAGVNAKLAGIVCKAHGKPPEIHVTGEDLFNVKFGVSGCCNEMQQRAVAAIS